MTTKDNNSFTHGLEPDFSVPRRVLNNLPNLTQTTKGNNELDNALDWQVGLVVREMMLQGVSDHTSISITGEMIDRAKVEAKQAILSWHNAEVERKEVLARCNGAMDATLSIRNILTGSDDFRISSPLNLRLGIGQIKEVRDCLDNLTRGYAQQKGERNNLKSEEKSHGK